MRWTEDERRLSVCSFVAPLSRSTPLLTVNFPLTPYGTADSSPAGCSWAVWRQRSDPARQAQPAKVLGPKLSFYADAGTAVCAKPPASLHREHLSADWGRSFGRWERERESAAFLIFTVDSWKIKVKLFRLISVLCLRELCFWNCAALFVRSWLVCSTVPFFCRC